MPGATSLTDRCQVLLAAQGQSLDDAQRKVLARLEGLRRRLLARQTGSSLIKNLLPGTRRTPLRGLWLWGGVGRGKTFLVDQFFTELSFAEKRREHFHRFMQDVHAGLRRHASKPSPLKHVAVEIAARAQLLCFDEFSVNDVADAMILAALLEELFRNGVTLVATSNLAPGDLYRDGLQRARFLPAIARIERHCKVMELDAGIDYRLRRLERAQLFLGPDIADAEARMAVEFERMADGPGVADLDVEVEGRPVRAVREGDDVVWFKFRKLCDGPRSAADYIEIARCYHTVLVSKVPVMDATSMTPRGVSSRWWTSSTIVASS